MVRFSATFTLVLILAAAGVSLVAAEETPAAEYTVGNSVPLDDNDLHTITVQVLERNPLLSSSPGIKYASAQRSVRSTDIADIIYHPHAETAGIKQAFQVQCQRQGSQPWACDSVMIRRYLALDSQDFQVRIIGDLESEEAQALIQATRQTVQSSTAGGSAVPDTAIMIFPEGDSYIVTWGRPEGYQDLSVEARLAQGGDPANPEDWQASIFVPEHLGR